MPREYYNLWTQTMQTWDPDKGFYALVFKDGATGELPDGRRLQLGFGDVHIPKSDLGKVHRDWADTLERFPDAAGQLEIVKLPCVFSRRDCWVPVADQLDAALAAATPKDTAKYWF